MVISTSSLGFLPLFLSFNTHAELCTCGRPTQLLLPASTYSKLVNLLLKARKSLASARDLRLKAVYTNQSPQVYDGLATPLFERTGSLGGIIMWPHVFVREGKRF